MQPLLSRWNSSSRVTRALLVAAAVLLFVQWSFEGLSLTEMAFAVPPLSTFCRLWYVPSVFRGPHHFDVPASVEDGMERLASLIAPPESPSARFTKRASARFALAVPVVATQLQDFVVALDVMLATPPSDEDAVASYMDIVMFFHRDQEAFDRAPGARAFRHAVDERAVKLTGAPARLVFHE